MSSPHNTFEAPPETPVPSPDPGPVDIVAPPDTVYRAKRFVIVFATLAMGVYFLYDGFHAYPKSNAEIVTNEAEQLIVRSKPEQSEEDKKRLSALVTRRAELKQYTDLDILFQKALGIVLPPAAFAILAWTLHATRGKYRLTDQTLTVPGHPPMPLNAITEVDDKRWDRKGIAVFSYSVSGVTGKFTLDDFRYKRTPTDQIYDAIRAAMPKP